MLNVLSSAGHAWFWVRHADLSLDERAAPLRVLFQWFFTGYGDALVHAAAVGTQNGGVLLAGQGGAGKSTAALACLGSGLRYAGDDYVLVSPATVRVFSLYLSAKLEQGHVQRVGDAVGLRTPTYRDLRSGKDVFFLPADQRELWSHGFPLRAILLVAFGSDRTKTTVRPAVKRVAIPMMVSSVLQIVGGHRSALSHISDVIRRLPVAVLETGRDLSGIPGAIGSFLRELEVA